MAVHELNPILCATPETDKEIYQYMPGVLSSTQVSIVINLYIGQ